MPLIKDKAIWIQIALVLIVFACNEPTSGKEEVKTDSVTTAVQPESPALSAYDSAMDAYFTGGESIKRLHDTLGMRLYVGTMKPGDTALLHSHPDHIAYILEGGKLAVSFTNGGRQILDFKKGDGMVGGPNSDAGKNVGNTTVKFLLLDVYRPRGENYTSQASYNSSLDPAIALPSSVKVLADSLNLKILVAEVKPGEFVKSHAHPDHAIYVLQGGKIAVYPHGGSEVKMDLVSNTGWIGGPLTDSAKNIGKTTIKFLEVDVYRPR